jgi:hypothetical protein
MAASVGNRWKAGLMGMFSLDSTIGINQKRRLPMPRERSFCYSAITSNFTDGLKAGGSSDEDIRAAVQQGELRYAGKCKGQLIS